MRTLTAAVVTFSISLMSSACFSQQISESEVIKKFVPKKATFQEMLSADLDGDGHPEVVVVYSSNDDVWRDVTLEVLRHEASGWKVAYKNDSDKMDKHDYVHIHKIANAKGKQAVVVIHHYEGAGTSTSWDLLAIVNRKVTVLSSAPLIQDALTRRGCVFMGYNGVSVEKDLIVDEMPGYSPHTARCCSDKPPLRLKFHFTGTSIKIDSIEETGPAPTKQ